MNVYIKAKVNAREDVVEKAEDGSLVVHVKEVPEKGKANRAIVRTVAEYFSVAPSRVRILTGRTSPKKLLEVIL